MQIGRRHKVACHFAGELNQAPQRPITTELLGVDDQGNSVGGGASAAELHGQPGYADTWFDLKTKSVTSA